MTGNSRIEGLSAARLIERLDLAPHPEGGWFRETWRTAAPEGQRAGATAILFLLDAGESSHWHRVDADEVWFWQAGGALELRLAASEAQSPRSMRLGPDLAGADGAQGIVPAGHWQAARPLDGWVLASCVVSPGFEFSGFELAAPGWSPGRGD